MCAHPTLLKPNANLGRFDIIMCADIIHTCQRCGACCRWEGDVCVTDEDITAIATFLGMREEDFIDQYCRLQRNRRGLSIIDAEDGACIMLTENGCRIQPVKPQQCKDFPYKWNFPGWENRCPGAGKLTGPES